MPDITEEEFLRQVTDPGEIEARALRRALHRAKQAGLTEEQRHLDEDEIWNRNVKFFRMQELIERLPPGKRRRKRPIGRPAGSSVSDADLVDAVKIMRDRHDVDGRRRSDQWASEILGFSRDTVWRARNGRPWTYFLRFVATDGD